MVFGIVPVFRQRNEVLLGMPSGFDARCLSCYHLRIDLLSPQDRRELHPLDVNLPLILRSVNACFTNDFPRFAKSQGFTPMPEGDPNESVHFTHFPKSFHDVQRSPQLFLGIMRHCI